MFGNLSEKRMLTMKIVSMGRTFEGMKVKMMRENPKVCFQIENLESFGEWQSVTCWGEFEELTDTIKT